VKRPGSSTLLRLIIATAAFGSIAGFLLREGDRFQALVAPPGRASAPPPVPPRRAALTPRQAELLRQIAPRAPRRASRREDDRLTPWEWEEIREIERLTTWRGTRVDSSTGEGDPLAAVRARIAEAIERSSLATPWRRQHLAWAVNDARCNVVGWDAVLRRLELDGSGWAARLEVRPHFEPRGGVLSTPDRCSELWLYYGDGRLGVIPCTDAHPWAGTLLAD
jgi:hypothetical protein